MYIKGLMKRMFFLMLIFYLFFLFTIPVYCAENDGVNSNVVVPTTTINNQINTAYVFLGDSRFVGMDKTVHLALLPDVYVIAKVGQGYDWLESNALPALNNLKATTNYDRYIVICNLGVNDLGNVNKYINILPALTDENTKLYWDSVNPTVDSSALVKCANIEQFNATLHQYIPNTNWIDTYTYLQVSGFNAHDGVHYDSATYTKLFYYMMTYVANMECSQNLSYDVTTRQA